ncbi:MAG: TIGR02266 family protein [Polyangiaceae bacterium]
MGQLQHMKRVERESGWDEPSGESGVVLVDQDRTHEPRAKRIDVTLVVGIESESNFYAGFTENVSECGVFVATYAPLVIGSTISLRILLPEGELVQALGTVRWVRPFSERNDGPPGMGIRFDQLSARDTARIQAFTEARAPMFFDDESDEPQTPAR